MNLREKKELVRELEFVISEMNKEIDCVIVEGKKDKRALEKLGFKGRIVYCSSQNNFNFKDCDVVSILTDFDSEGRKIRKNLLEKLMGVVKINKGYRKKFGELLTIYGRRDIESINNLLDSGITA